MSEFPAVSDARNDVMPALVLTAVALLDITMSYLLACHAHASPALERRHGTQQLDDFDDFSAPTGGSAGQGDFLARERELLGDEFGPTPTDLPSTGDFDEKPSRSSFPALDGDDSDNKPAASRPSNDFISSFERDQPAAPAASSISAKVEEDDDDDAHDDAMLHADINKFQTQYPDLQVYPAVDQQQQQSQQVS